MNTVTSRTSIPITSFMSRRSARPKRRDAYDKHSSKHSSNKHRNEITRKQARSTSAKFQRHEHKNTPESTRKVPMATSCFTSSTRGLARYLGSNRFLARQQPREEHTCTPRMSQVRPWRARAHRQRVELPPARKAPTAQCAAHAGQAARVARAVEAFPLELALDERRADLVHD